MLFSIPLSKLRWLCNNDYLAYLVSLFRICLLIRLFYQFSYSSLRWRFLAAWRYRGRFLQSSRRKSLLKIITDDAACCLWPVVYMYVFRRSLPPSFSLFSSLPMRNLATCMTGWQALRSSSSTVPYTLDCVRKIAGQSRTWLHHVSLCYNLVVLSRLTSSRRWMKLSENSRSLKGK